MAAIPDFAAGTEMFSRFTILYILHSDQKLEFIQGRWRTGATLISSIDCGQKPETEND